MSIDIGDGRSVRMAILDQRRDQFADFDARDFAATVADSAIAELRKLGLDCVSKGSYDDASHVIRQAIFRAVILSANPPAPAVPPASTSAHAD